MPETFTLDDRLFEHALKVLEREQRAYLPSRLQNIAFRAFNLVVVAVIACWAVIALHELLEFDMGVAYEAIDEKVLLGGVGASFVLFLANIPLMRKLWKLGILRNAIGMHREFRYVFALFEKTPWRVFGLCLSVLALVFIGILTVIGLSEADPLVVAAILITGGSLLATLLMARSKRRGAIISQLQQALSTQPRPEGTDRRTPISQEDLDEIATIERTQIIRDRRESIVAASSSGHAPQYDIQMSREAREAKASLDPDSRTELDRHIFELMRDPAGVQARDEPATGMKILTIEHPDLEIAYQVDEERHRVRLYHLRRGTELRDA